MDITPIPRLGQSHIQSYSAGMFRVNGEIYKTPLIVLPESVDVWTVVPDDLFALSSFEYLAGKIDVLLIGTGARMVLCLPAQRGAFKMLGMSVDTMDTPAACRTFNVLNSEGRRVCAALVPV
ncbi:MAG: Mth938-like domain-containing protein [Pseudobdellovibrionaceae bacterium]